MTISDVLTVAPVILVGFGIAPLLRANHKAKLNLSVWAVITANAWLAGVGNLFAEQKGASAFYMIAYAIIVTPVLFFNLKKGVWGELPSWHKIAAGILPLGTLLGVAYGGEMATWSSFAVSLLLTVQLIESTWKKVAREHLTTWSFFLFSDGGALIFGWATSNYSLRCLLGLWVLQCLVVMGIEIRNRRSDALGKNKHFPTIAPPDLAMAGVGAGRPAS
jgi:hypothetical protein